MHKQIIYGKHSALEALKNPQRKILEVFVQNEKLMKLIPQNFNANIVDINKKFPHINNHQGIVVIAKPLPQMHLEDLNHTENEACILILDQITDPQNLGAIIRSAAAFNIKAIILQEFTSLIHSHVVTRIASGGAEYVPLISVTNTTTAINIIKSYNFWVYGCTDEAEYNLPKQNLKGKIALVIGAEGKGIRPLVKKNCDVLYKIPTNSKFKTLNASHAATIVMYEAYSNILNKK